jgi:hypothetical protein
MRPLLLPSGSPGGTKGNGCTQREARNNKVGGKLGQLARCQEVSFSSEVPGEPASKHHHRGDEDLSALDERRVMVAICICFPDHNLLGGRRDAAPTVVARSIHKIEVRKRSNRSSRTDYEEDKPPPRLSSRLSFKRTLCFEDLRGECTPQPQIGADT